MEEKNSDWILQVTISRPDRQSLAFFAPDIFPDRSERITDTGVYIELDQGELRDMIQYSCNHRFTTILYTVNIDSDRGARCIIHDTYARVGTWLRIFLQDSPGYYKGNLQDS